MDGRVSSAVSAFVRVERGGGIFWFGGGEETEHWDEWLGGLGRGIRMRSVFVGC